MLIRKLTYFLVIIAASIFVFSYYLQKPPYLSFSDAAKFADIARNLNSGLGYGSSFALSSSFSRILMFPSPAPWTPPFTVFSMLTAFKIFGISDISAIVTSAFYYILLVLFTYLLARKLFGNLAGTLGTIAVIANPDILNYAASGASETPFIFEIVASAYFLTLKKKWATAIGFILLILMYFTRRQAFIYIAGLILFYLLSRFKTKKAILLFIAVLAFGFLVDRIILLPLAGRYFLYPITSLSSDAISQYAPGIGVSDALRGSFVSLTLLSIFKKVFYNLYNFYKLMPQIMSPYLFGLFVICLFRWTKDKIYNSFKIATIFMVIVTFLVTALSIPFFRYLHPVVPLVYILAAETLVWIISEMANGQWLKAKSKKLFIILASTFLILTFGVGQTLGVIFLDSRFERNTHNVGKPPVYVQLSYILKNNIPPNQIALTNLDTWGSWYGERKTIWYPLTPEQIIPQKGENNPFDVIYLTSYLMDDQNYFMGPEWRRIFENPTSFSTKDCAGCEFIKENYKLGGIYNVPASEDYERQDAKAVLLVKK